MQTEYIYIGVFVSLDDVILGLRPESAKSLDMAIKESHVTLKYRPDKVNKSLFGKVVDVSIIGYGNDGDNEGFLVELFSPYDEIQEMINALEVPHITISVSKTGSPVNTKNLQFGNIGRWTIPGIFGGFNQNGQVIINPDGAVMK